MAEAIELKELSEPIPIDQVEFRVQSISRNGWATLLAYKDARVDMDRLDAVVGRYNWQRLHEKIDGANYCKVGIWDKEKEQWIWKQDVGTPSTYEAVKGEASDAFKRACFNLGIGRELYDYPLLLVQLNENEFRVNGDKVEATYDLRLKDWTWDSKRSDPDENGKSQIEELTALDENGKQRFKYPRTNNPQDSRPQQQQSASSSSSSSSTAEKDWYNDYDDQKEWFQKQINAGKTAKELLTALRQKYKVNKKTQSAIEALKPAKQENFDNFNPDDDIPF